MEKNNLSKLKKQDLINKKTGKAMSGETSLASDISKGDISFKDLTSTDDDTNYGGKIKQKPHNTKYATKSKTDPSNGSLDSEKMLSDDLSKGDKKFTDNTSTEADNKIKNSHIKKGGSGKTSADSSLASKSSFKKGTKSAPSNSKLSSEDFLADNFTHLMNFGQFVNEAYDDGEDKEEEKKECTCGENPCECDDKEEE